MVSGIGCTAPGALYPELESPIGRTCGKSITTGGVATALMNGLKVLESVVVVIALAVKETTNPVNPLSSGIPHWMGMKY